MRRKAKRDETILVDSRGEERITEGVVQDVAEEEARMTPSRSHSG